MDQARSADGPPLSRGLEWASTVGVAAFVVAVQMWIFDRKTIPMDEGHLAAAATRILGGEILYRDIHTGIGPGIYHVGAVLFALFGDDLVVLRWAQVAVNTTIAVLLWRLALRIVRPHWAVVPPAGFALLATVGFPVLTMLNYSSLALATALAALLVLLRYLETPRSSAGTRLGVLLGILLAVTALTKQNYGALAILATGIAITWNRSQSALADRGWFASVLPVVGSGAALALVTTVYFAAHAALGDLIGSTLLDLGATQLTAFDNPIPPILGELPRDQPRFVFLYTPPTLFNHMLQGGTFFGLPITPFLRETSVRLSYGIPLLALFVAPALLWATAELRDERMRRGSRVAVLFAAAFFLGIFPSAIWSHLAFVIPPTLLVIALVGDRLEAWGERRVAWMHRAGIGVAAAIALVCLAGSVRIAALVQAWYPDPLALPRATLYVEPDMAAIYRGSVEFVERCAGPDESIFVAPDIPILYFLTGRRNPTPYDLTIPGNVDGRVIIDALEADGTRCIVYNPRMYPEFPDFEVLFPELDRYLRETFERRVPIRGGTRTWIGLVRSEGLPR